jgi:hypothetical protein
MGGDEIVAEWLGDTYSAYVTTSASVQRFSATSLRLKDVKIYNYHNTEVIYIGKYNSSAATVSNYALIIAGYGTMDFKYIDLYELGFRMFTGGTVHTLRVFGSNIY